MQSGSSLAAAALPGLSQVDAWSTTVVDFYENDAMLLAGWTGGEFSNAAEILRATYPAGPNESLAQFKRMLLTVYVPLLRMFYPEANGNWDAAKPPIRLLGRWGFSIAGRYGSLFKEDGAFAARDGLGSLLQFFN